MSRLLNVVRGDEYDIERWRVWLAEHGIDMDDVYEIQFLDDTLSTALVRQWDKDSNGKRYLVNREVATKPDVVFAVKRHPPRWTARHRTDTES